MVFAPSFVRCPYQDYNQALMAAEKEKGFLLFLFERIPSSPIAQERVRTYATSSKLPAIHKEAQEELDKLLNETQTS